MSLGLLISDISGLGLVLIGIGLMLIFHWVYRKDPMKGLRPIPAFTKLRQKIGLAVEDGSRLHVSLGNASPLSQQGASALVGLSVLEQISRLSAASDQPPVATSGDGALATLSQDSLRAVNRKANTMSLYDPAQGRLVGPTPLSYIAGTIPTIENEQVSANLFIGNYGPEVALLTDAAEQNGSFSLAGSDSMPAQAVFYATASEPLIGEEVFASGAYLQNNALHSASLRTQDVLRWIVIFVILFGGILQLMGFQL